MKSVWLPLSLFQHTQFIIGKLLRIISNMAVKLNWFILKWVLKGIIIYSLNAIFYPQRINLISYLHPTVAIICQLHLKKYFPFVIQAWYNSRGLQRKTSFHMTFPFRFCFQPFIIAIDGNACSDYIRPFTVTLQSHFDLLYIFLVFKWGNKWQFPGNKNVKRVYVNI